MLRKRSAMLVKKKFSCKWKSLVFVMHCYLPLFGRSREPSFFAMFRVMPATSILPDCQYCWDTVTLKMMFQQVCTTASVCCCRYDLLIEIEALMWFQGISFQMTGIYAYRVNWLSPIWLLSLLHDLKESLLFRLIQLQAALEILRRNQHSRDSHICLYLLHHLTKALPWNQYPCQKKTWEYVKLRGFTFDELIYWF